MGNFPDQACPRAEGGTCHDRGQGKSLGEAGAKPRWGREPEVTRGATGIRAVKGPTSESGDLGVRDKPHQKAGLI